MEKISIDRLKELLEKIETEVAAKDFENAKDTYELGFDVNLCILDSGDTIKVN